MGGFNGSTWLWAECGCLLVAATIGGLAGVAAWIKWSRRAGLRALLYTALGCLVLLGGLRLVGADGHHGIGLRRLARLGGRSPLASAQGDHCAS